MNQQLNQQLGEPTAAPAAVIPVSRRTVEAVVGKFVAGLAAGDPAVERLRAAADELDELDGQPSERQILSLLPIAREALADRDEVRAMLDRLRALSEHARLAQPGVRISDGKQAELFGDLRRGPALKSGLWRWVFRSGEYVGDIVSAGGGWTPRLTAAGRQDVHATAEEAAEALCRVADAGGPVDRRVRTRMYNYAVLDPRPSERWRMLAFLASTLAFGVEVTVPELAAACQVGNLDPQHGPGGDSGTSAIEAALECDLPPVGVTLVTIRPDGDAYGAKAVLELRASDHGGDRWQDAVVDDEARAATPDEAREIYRRAVEPVWVARARAIGVRDRTARRPDGAVAIVDAYMAAAVSQPDPDAGVDLATQFLTTGDFAGSAEWVRKVEATEAEIASVLPHVQLEAGGRVAVVETTSAAGVQAAYRRADVAVVVNPQFRRPGARRDEAAHRKITVCQQRAGLVDLPAVLAELSAREPGWGGSPTIIGSPHGTASTIPTADVVAVVERHLTSAAVQS